MALEWMYRGEGNSSLVIARKEGHVVYRLLKQCIRNDNKKRKVDYSILEQKLHNGIDYGKYIFLPRISPFLTVGRVVSLPPGFASLIKEKVQCKRPVSRLCKEIDVNFPHAVTLPDFCFIQSSNVSETCPTFSIEIKPKWGYIPNSCHITKEIKYRVCRFCMHQYLKISRGKWANHSLYCPIDLFSGNPTRVRHALRMLLKEPQNNLRLFKNDKLIHSDVKQEFSQVIGPYFASTAELKNASHKSALDNFIEIVTKSLLYVPKCTRVPAKSGHRSQVCDGNKLYCAQSKSPGCHDMVINNHSPANGYSHETTSLNNRTVKESILQPGCVLHRILYIQMLDDLDIEGLYPMYETVKEKFEKDGTAREISEVDGPYHKYWLTSPTSSVKAYSNSPVSTSHGPSACPADAQSNRPGTSQASDEDSDPVSIMHAILKVKEFLVSRSAKDCSIMVTIQPLSKRDLDIQNKCQSEEDKENDNLPENEFLCEQSGRIFHCAVNVIDLDPKPFDKISYYKTEDREVVQHFLNSLHMEV